MAKSKSFAVGMGSSTAVKNTVSSATMLNNNVDTGYNLKYLPLECIIPNKLNKDFPQEEIEEIRLSIKLHGIYHPLVVIDNEDGRYRLISGEKRYHAFEGMPKEEREAQFPMGIPCKLDKIPDNDEVEEEIRINEANMLARTYSPKERVARIRRLIELYQIKQERGQVSSVAQEIMKKYAITERMARKYVAANRMIPELQSALDQGLINITESEKFAAFSEEAQKQILELLQDQGKVNKSDLQVIRKAEEEKKQLEEKVVQTAKELEDKTSMVEALEKQVSSLLKEVETIKSEASNKTSSGNNSENVSNDNADDIEDIRKKLELTQQLLKKEETERKRAQTNLERAQQEAKERESRSITASKEELKKAADYAKAENIHELMFKQLKELEKVKDTIKLDDTLKVQFNVIAEGLISVFK